MNKFQTLFRLNQSLAKVCTIRKLAELSSRKIKKMEAKAKKSETSKRLIWIDCEVSEEKFLIFILKIDFFSSICR